MNRSHRSAGDGVAADDLDARSIELLRTLQSGSGAFIASPSVVQYRYCWLRDGSFIAHALGSRGFTGESRAFHDWVGRVIRNQAGTIGKILGLRTVGEAPPASDMLPTRFTLDGDMEAETSVEEAWPNFQLDGYGAWLWALDRHVDAMPLDDELREAVRMTADYLGACWELPCFDWWEEFGDRQHTSTLASIAAGLRAAAAMLSDRHYAGSPTGCWSASQPRACGTVGSSRGRTTGAWTQACSRWPCRSAWYP